MGQSNTFTYILAHACFTVIAVESPKFANFGLSFTGQSIKLALILAHVCCSRFNPFITDNLSPKLRIKSESRCDSKKCWWDTSPVSKTFVLGVYYEPIGSPQHRFIVNHPYFSFPIDSRGLRGSGTHFPNCLRSKVRVQP